jgi:Leucine-rich repeat (LRR) protein
LRAIEDTIGSVVTKEKLETIKRISWDEYMAESDPNSWSPVHDISGIGHCVNLEELFFDGNGVYDLWPLANLTKLREIRMVQNQIKDLEPLRFLNNLKSLVLDMNTALEDISPIANLPVLEYLNIGGTQVKDITPLQGLAKIKKVSLYNSKALPLDERSPNRKALIELIIKGVEIHIEDIEKCVREAEQEKENRSK